MDSQTAAFYQCPDDVLLADYENADVAALHAEIRRWIKPGGRALDIGGGTGRDAAFLVAGGLTVTYTDASPAMLSTAVGLHPELTSQARVAVFPLPHDDPLLDARFDLILCLAVIMHLDEDELQRLLAQMARLAVPEAVVMVSHSDGRRGLIGGRDRRGRLYRERPARVVVEVARRHGLRQERQIETADGLSRHTLRWTTHVLRQSG